MRSKVSIFFTLIVVASMLLVACQPLAAPTPAPPAPEKPTAAPEKPTVPPTEKPAVQPKIETQIPVNVPRDKVFVIDQIFRYSVVNNFNLFVSGPPTPTRQGLCFDGLWYIDQQTGEWINSLATEKPTYNKDFTEMTVKLRPGVFWSDGKEFSADDVVFTVQMLMKTPGMANSAQLNLYVKDVAKKDNNTVVFTLKEPNPRFHMFFTMRYNAVYIIPKHVWEKVQDPLKYDFFPPVSLGAYVFQEADPNGYWELFKRRDDWQKTTPGIITGKPGPEYILTIFYGGSDKKVIAMARHDLDVFMDVDYEAFKALLKQTPTARSWFKDFPWAYPNELDSRYFGFNYTIKPYDNKDVRWALALALNIVELQTEYIGGVTRITPIPQPATDAQMKLYHVPLEPWLKELKIDVGGGETFQPYDPDVPKKVAEWAKKQGYTVPSDPEGLRDRFGMGWWKFAPDVAEKLLKKAGLTKSAQGKWQTADGKPFKISILAAPDEQDVYRLAIGAQDQWRKFGIEVDVEAVERDPYYTRNNTGDFNVISGWGQAGGGLSVNAIADKWQAIQGLHSRYFTKIGDSTAATGSNNTSRFKFPEIDKIIDQLAAVHPDDPKALELGRDFMKFWVENMVGITTISFKKFITIDEYYFTGFPTSEKPGRQPLYWFIGGRFSLPLVEPVKK